MLVTLSRTFDPGDVPDLCNIDSNLDLLEGGGRAFR
jgi:hypothetical protein